MILSGDERAVSDPWDSDAPVDIDEEMSSQPVVGNEPAEVEAPPMTVSEAMARRLGIIGTALGTADLGLQAGTQMANMAGRGFLGIAGFGVGMLPGGDSPAEASEAFMDVIPEDFFYTVGSEEGQVMGRRVEGVLGDVAEAGQAVMSGVEAAGAGTRAAVEGYPVAPTAEYAFDQAQQRRRSVGDYFYDLADMMLDEGNVQGRALAGTVGTMAPEILAGGTGRVRPTSRPIRSTPTTRPADAMGEIQRILSDVEETLPTAEFDRLQKAIRAGDRTTLLEVVSANPEIVDAFSRLNIEPTLGMVSDNAAFRQVEAGLASAPESGLTSAQEGIEALINRRTAELMDEQGASLFNPEALDANVRGYFDAELERLDGMESAAYDELAVRIDRSTPVDMRDAAARVNETFNVTGDIADAQFSKFEEALFRLANRRNVDEDGNVTYEPREPTYEAVDRLRRRVGTAMDSRTGEPFGDSSSGDLKVAYRELSEALGRVADDEGFADLRVEAFDLTKQRIALQERYQDVAGKRLDKDIVTGLRTAAQGLLKGEVRKWESFIDSVPAELRMAAAAQALEQVVFTAARNTRMSQGWLPNYEKLINNPDRMDRIFRYLPEDARQTFIDIGLAAKGFYRATEKVNRANTANALRVIKALEEPVFLARILGGVVDQTVGRVPIIADGVRTLLRRSPDDKTAKNKARLEAGVKLLGDRRFQEAVTEYALGNIERANQLLQDSTSWAAWLAQTQSNRIERAGIVALFEDDENE